MIMSRSRRIFHSDGKQDRKKQPKEEKTNTFSVSVYADGSSGGRSQEPGGYGWVVLVNGRPISAGYGGHPCTTNNRMELQAAICGLEHFQTNILLSGHYDVELVSDSQYVLGVASGYYNSFRNIDLADRLKLLCREIGVSFRWVKGHSNDPWNERCDKLAKQGKKEAQKALLKGEEPSVNDSQEAA